MVDNSWHLLICDKFFSSFHQNGSTDYDAVTLRLCVFVLFRGPYRCEHDRDSYGGDRTEVHQILWHWVWRSLDTKGLHTSLEGKAHAPQAWGKPDQCLMKLTCGAGGHPDSLQKPSWTSPHPLPTPYPHAAAAEIAVCLLCHWAGRVLPKGNRKAVNTIICFARTTSCFFPDMLFRAEVSPSTEPCSSMLASSRPWRTWIGTVWSFMTWTTSRKMTETTMAAGRCHAILLPNWTSICICKYPMVRNWTITQNITDKGIPV